jgi:glycosyltransferase involved in cell wall biosynthesis
MKRIGIDARFLGTETGIGRYVEELVKNLEEIDRKNEYYIFLTEKNWDLYSPPPHSPPISPRAKQGELEGVHSNFHKVKANFRWYSWQEQAFFPFLIKKYKLDLMHFPHFNVPLFCLCPFIVTIHDLILLHHPSTRATKLGFARFYLKYAFYRMVLKYAIINSKIIFAPSKFTKTDIMNNFSVPEDKIVVTYEASSLNDVAPAKKEFLADLKITKPYFLTVGNAYPHKNLERLLRVFKRFNSAQKNKFQLVFAGPDNYFYQRLKNYRKEIGFKKNEVIMPARASDSQLKLLYLNAFAYIFPSLYEGFGLPGLEAMACGAPVMAADRTSLPEIYGNAAFYFNAKSDEEMFNALIRFSGDDKLRRHLRERGFEVAKQYNWLDLAKKTLSHYAR